MPKKKVVKKTAKPATKPIKAEKCCDWKCKTTGCHTSGGCFYFLGGLGAAIYYIMAATSFWGGVLGVLKALIWPLFLVFELFTFLGV